MNNFNYTNLTPFKWFVLENFPFIEADFDALTEWQLFCKLGKEINKIIKSENILGTQVESVTKAFIELQNYVNNYFNNLDVQEEINIKLNEMVEDGTLAKILMNYTQITKTYNTFQDLLNDTTLTNNMKVNTLGYYNINDGGNGTYYISNNENLSGYKIKNNNLYIYLIEKIYNVKQFGAKGDGINDDTSFIQEALNYDNIYIPSGIYNISSELLSYSTHITLESNAILKAISEVDAIISINPYRHRNQYGFIKNGIIDCNNLAKIGIGLSNYQYFTIDNMFIKNIISEGINLGYKNLADGDAGGCFITNTIVWGSDTADDTGINLQKSNDITVKSVVLKNCKTGFKILGGNIKLLNVHGWTTGLDKYYNSKMIACSNGRISLSDCVIDTYHYGIYGNDQIFTSITNLQYIGIEKYTQTYTPTIIYSEPTGTNNSNINLNGLLISANAGTVKLLSDSLLVQAYNTRLQNYIGIENLPSISNVNLINTPNNSLLFNYKASGATELTLSTNYDTLEEVIYRVNTYNGSGGTNTPPENITGVLLNYANNTNNNYKNNGVQIIFSSTGKIYYRILRVNVWSSWFTIENQST